MVRDQNNDRRTELNDDQTQAQSSFVPWLSDYLLRHETPSDDVTTNRIYRCMLDYIVLLYIEEK